MCLIWEALPRPDDSRQEEGMMNRKLKLQGFSEVFFFAGSRDFGSRTFV